MWCVAYIVCDYDARAVKVIRHPSSSFPFFRRRFDVVGYTHEHRYGVHTSVRITVSRQSSVVVARGMAIDDDAIDACVAWFWCAFIACSMCAATRARGVVPGGVRRAIAVVAQRGKDGDGVGVDDDDDGGRGGRGRDRGVMSVVMSVVMTRVPHRWFQHFYVVGVCANARTLSSAAKRAGGRDEDAYVVYALVLFQVHLCRRLYESVFVSVYSSCARMHVAAYVLGLAYYACASQSWASALGDGVGAVTPVVPHLASAALAVCGTVLFIIGNVNQHRCHVILANLRRGKRSRDEPSVRSYAIPRGGWFERFSCAHYTAEIVLYVGLLLIVAPSHVYITTRGDDVDAFRNIRAPILLVCAVVANLAVAARAHHEWYLANFPSTYPSHRTALFPSFTFAS
jgi:3-oxo-5-alpha-steroid 4-dehydrogenase 3 / polyprenol reductase